MRRRLAAWRLSWARCWQCDRIKPGNVAGRFCSPACQQSWDADGVIW